MLLNMCFSFMMFTDSLVDFPFLKRGCGNSTMPSWRISMCPVLRVIWVRYPLRKDSLDAKVVSGIRAGSIANSLTLSHQGGRWLHTFIGHPAVIHGRAEPERGLRQWQRSGGEGRGRWGPAGSSHGRRPDQHID